LHCGLGKAACQIKANAGLSVSIDGLSHRLEPAVSGDFFEPRAKGAFSTMIEMMDAFEDLQQGLLENVFDIMDRDIPRLHPASHYPSVFSCELIPSRMILLPESLDK
jgi:hypothetical protein